VVPRKGLGAKQLQSILRALNPTLNNAMTPREERFTKKETKVKEVPAVGE